jgi:hypothetical protein
MKTVVVEAEKSEGEEKEDSAVVEIDYSQLCSDIPKEETVRPIDD